MTPAIDAVRKAGVSHRLFTYTHDPEGESYGQEAAAKIGFAKALSYYVDLSDEEYRQLHDDGHSPGLTYDHREEFLVESIGEREEKDFIDFGIEYYRYRGERGPAPAAG